MLAYPKCRSATRKAERVWRQAYSSRSVRDSFSHIIDPRTGRPVPALAQVTVLAHSAARAEAISTALLVLGRNSLRQISRTLAVDVCWIDRSGVYTTPGFRLRRAGGAKAIQIRS